MKHISLHRTLAHSYLTYFIFSIVGLFADTVIGFSMTYVAYTNEIAVACFGVGTLLIIWAQYTSRYMKHDEEIQNPYFFKGPYRYMRNPTHLGIVFLVTGYTAVSGSLVFFGVTIIAYFISNILFQRYEALLVRTYDGEYKAYKSKVPKIL